MKVVNGTAYFPTRQEAEGTMSALPPFAPSRYLSAAEIARGDGNPRVNEFGLGFAIQLGFYGSYYPATTADGSSPIERREQAVA